MQGAPREDFDLLTRICRRGFHPDLTELAVEMRTDISDQAVYARISNENVPGQDRDNTGAHTLCEVQIYSTCPESTCQESRGQQKRCQDQPEN